MYESYNAWALRVVQNCEIYHYTDRHELRYMYKRTLTAVEPVSDCSVLEGQVAELTVQYNDSLEVSVESRYSVTYCYTQSFKWLQFICQCYCDVDAILCMA
jgi:hypothetical protein